MGNARYVIGHIDYIKDKTLIYVIMGCAAGVSVFVTTVGVIAWCWKNRRNDEKRERRKSDPPQADIAMANMNAFPVIKR